MAKTDEQIKSFNKVPDYNGWTNKPTWAVALWIDNDQGLQSIVREAAWNDKDDARLLSGWLQDMFNDDYFPALPASMYSDLLTCALAYVDWDSLAEHYIEAAKEI